MGWSSIESDADRKVQGRERQRQTDKQRQRLCETWKHGDNWDTERELQPEEKKKKALKGVAQRQWEGSRRACVTLAM